MWPSKGLDPNQKILGNQPLFFEKPVTIGLSAVVKATAESLKQGPATIDALVDARRREKGLTASPRADAPTLLKRLHFDLSGLPPNDAK